jgi:hypothetical protein
MIEKLRSFFLEHSASRKTDAAKTCGLFFYEAKEILEALETSQEYADAYRNWHITKDYSGESMKRFRAAREAFLKAHP